jgi:hypothetical protein
VHQVTRHRYVLYAAVAGYWARMSRENVDVALRAFDAWNRGDIDAWLALVHADIEWFSEKPRPRSRGAVRVGRIQAGASSSGVEP